MTVTTETAAITHTGNGILTEFNIPFKFFSADHIQVSLVTIATGATEILSPASYTIDGEGEETGGTLTYSPAITSDYQLYIERVLPYTQDISLEREGGFFPEIIEEQLDKIVMMVQLLRAELLLALESDISSITRNVAGPASSTVNRFASYNNTTGTLLKDSGYGPADFAAAVHTHDYAADDHTHPPVWTELMKTSDWSRASSTTLASDADLTFAMEANTTYIIEGTLYVNSVINVGHKLGITGPASPTLVTITSVMMDSSLNSWDQGGAASYTTFEADIPGSTVKAIINFSARIENGANAGNFAIQFAQNISSGTAATLYKGSYIRYREVA